MVTSEEDVEACLSPQFASFFYAKMAKESLFTILKYFYQIEYVVFVVGHR